MGYSTSLKTVPPREARRTSAGKTFGIKSDLGDPVRYSAESHESVYVCPYCEPLVGKADDTGKLYYNERKGIGHCFRCGTIVHDDAERTMDEEVDREISMRDMEIKEQLQIREKLTRQQYGLGFWTTSAIDVKPAKHYLNARGMTDAEIVRWDLRACTSPDVGIVIPNRILPKDRTDFFQIRRLGIAPDDKLKYRNPKNAEKPIFNLHSVAQPRTRVVVAEGVFSAIAADRASQALARKVEQPIVAVATYGKSIKKIHTTLFSEIEPISEFYICYDGGEWWSSINAAKALSTLGKPVSVIMLPFGCDPEESGDEIFNHCIQKSTFRYSRSFLNFLQTSIKDKPETQRGWEKYREYLVSQNKLFTS